MTQPFLERLVPTDSSFLAYLREKDQFPFEWHYHPEYEIVAILEGEGERFVGDHLDLYRAGDIVMTGPDLPHTWRSKETSRKNRAIVIQFGREFLGAPFFAAPEFAQVRRLLEASHHGLVFRGAVRARALQVIEAMLDLHEFPRLLKLLELLDLLSKAGPHKERLSSQLFDTLPTDAERSRFEEAFSEIVRHYREPIWQSEVARRLHLTPATFSRLFKRHCGRSFTQCLIEYRVAIACRLLQETELQITEICERCGFLNLSNFNRQFLKLKGLSPRAYRNQWRGQKP